MPITLPEFIHKWQAAQTSERSSAQQHFLDLCELLGQPRPSDLDSGGTFYTFEKAVSKSAGGGGFADVWFRGHFAWEYKGKGKDLKAAYQQLLQYRESLENPPLLVVCDLDRFEVHTNFTDTIKRVYNFNLAGLASSDPLADTKLSALEVLRALFEDPARLKPQLTSAEVTEHAAREFAQLADNLRRRGEDSQEAAHFLMRLLFCLFAEDIGLLPSRLFTRIVERRRNDPTRFNSLLRKLFAEMATGGEFDLDDIPYFNGGLFSDDRALDLHTDDLRLLVAATALDWSSVEPAIFGTLFERSLDPAKRKPEGTHYTSRADILLIVEPVLMAPLRRRWDEVRAAVEGLVAQRDAATVAKTRNSYEEKAGDLLLTFARELGAVRVLDPACGSGNFLYVALKSLLDLWKEVYLYPSSHNIRLIVPETVRPQQLYGIEKNVVARELASVVVWIGYLQWMHDNGIENRAKPILQPLNNIALMDAILDYDAAGQPIEPAWPQADVIVGNPPFLGGNRIRQELGDEYVNNLFKLYDGRVPAFADLVVYWFEKAREQIGKGMTKRAGLLATQGIRGGVNRKVLERIKETGGIFWAQSDRNWLLDGATVHVSMVGFDDGTRLERELDGKSVSAINPDLTSAVDLTVAKMLKENLYLSFQGPSPKAPFDIEQAIAENMVQSVGNINGRPNTDVVRPVVSAIDLAQRSRNKWTIDFGLMPIEQAVEYEAPFEYVKKHVYPVRSTNRRAAYAAKWWQYAEARPGIRQSLAGKTRFIATPRVSKHRIFVWLNPEVLANDGTIVFARDDDYFFGVLHSKLHELWARRTGTQLREAESGFRYTPTSTFETFPFPWPPGKEPAGDPRVEAIAQAARDLVEKRDRWLDPAGASAEELKKRTLTNLYNARPAWLDMAHKKLDAAVAAAYGWPHDTGDEALLERLLALNLARAGGDGP